MKTQNLIILIVFCILSVSSLEAKPRTVNINFDVVYPPLMPLETNIRSYYPVLLFEGNSKGVISDVSSIIKLNGYKKVSSIEKSDLLIKFIVNSVDTEVSIKRLEDIKSRGALATTKAMYTLKSKLSFNYIIKDLKNNRVIESKSSSVDTIYNSIVYSNYNRATKAANALKEDKARTLYEKLLINKLQCFINKVNSNYGYSIRTINLPISICENNDNFTAELKKAFSDFYLLRDVYKEEGLTDSIRTVINSCMNTWDKAISKYNLCRSNSRIKKENIVSIYLNKASGYIILKDWISAKKYIDNAKYLSNHSSNVSIINNYLNNLEKRYKALTNKEIQNNFIKKTYASVNYMDKKY